MPRDEADQDMALETLREAIQKALSEAERKVGTSAVAHTVELALRGRGYQARVMG